MYHNYNLKSILVMPLYLTDMKIVFISNFILIKIQKNLKKLEIKNEKINELRKQNNFLLNLPRYEKILIS